MHNSITDNKRASVLLSIIMLTLCLLMTACDVTITTTGSNSGSASSSGNGSTNTSFTGSGAQNVQLYVEPDDGVTVVTQAIDNAQKSIWLEMYLFTNTTVLHALERAAQRGLDVRVMLEPHPVGGSSPTRVLDELQAAGAKTETTSPAFTLTHEKGMVIDGKTAFIMTSNFSVSALGGSSHSSYRNREYGIIDSNPQDVQAVADIFTADWNRSNVQLTDPNLVVSPINSRADFLKLINSAHHTLDIEAEEMQDSQIEQAIVSAGKRGVQVEVILPSASSASTDSNRNGIDAIQGQNVKVEEDAKLYMHAKIIIVDGQKAFVGSENISTNSLDHNRELGIIVSDQNVLNRLEQTFQTDWGTSQAV